MSNSYDYLVNGIPVKILYYNIIVRKEYGICVHGIRVSAMYEGVQICEFDFIKVDQCTYADHDVVIFDKKFRRKGIYTFVIDKLEEFYNVRVIPSNLLTESGKKFWKNRLSKTATLSSNVR